MLPSSIRLKYFDRCRYQSNWLSADFAVFQNSNYITKLNALSFTVSVQCLTTPLNLVILGIPGYFIH